jgi:transposase
MARFIGLDVHKHFIEVCAVDARGKIVFRGTAGCLRDELVAFARAHFKKTDRVALEATTNTWAVVKILRPFVAEVVVGNPLKTRVIAEARVKTDKVDAQVLAQLLRCDYLPTVWQPDDYTQRLRALSTHREALMAQRSRCRNHVQGLLARLLLQPPCKVLWSKGGMVWLKSLELPTHVRLMLASELRQIETIDGELVTLDTELAAIAKTDARVQLLMTIPGVNYVVALGMLAALGDICRFPDGAHAASYLGLVPSTKQSGRHCYHGPITKAGSGQVRGLLTQAAQHASRHCGPIGVFFRRLARRKSRQVAITAVARKLVTIAYLMLKNNEPYRYAKPKLMRQKFTTLRARCQEEPKAVRPRRPITPPSANLKDVYEAVGLPRVRAPHELPDGERRMLTDRGLQNFVTGLYGAAEAEPDLERSGRSTSAASRQGTPRPAGRLSGRRK